MDKLPPIRTPFSVIWRELRIQVLPLIVFAVIVLSTLMLWRTINNGNSIPGLGEGVRSTVASPAIGWLQELLVQPFERVEAGQPIARLLPVNPQAQLDLLASELQLARLRLEPSLADQNAMNFEQVRVEWLRLKQEVAIAKVNLERTENALRRNLVLYKEKLVSEDVYDFSLQERNMYKAEVEEKSKAVAQMEERLTQLRSVGEPEAPGTNSPLLSLVANLETRIAAAQTNWIPVTLVAPISGIVHAAYRHSGEFVIEGEPLIIINAERSDRVVGYLRQPYPVEPEVGMNVEVVTRTRDRQKFASQITQVGAQVETITNVLAYIKQGSLVDVGLPISVAVPPGINIRPGELVDVTFTMTMISPLAPANSKESPPKVPLASARP